MRESAPAPELASRGSRLVAQIVDILIAVSLFFAGIVLPGSLAFLINKVNLVDAQLLFALIELGPWVGSILFLLYYLLADGLPNGQSLGKRLVKIAVVDDESGTPCTLAKSAVRNLTQILGFLDWIWIFGEKRKRAGDVLAHTRVVVA